MTDNGVNPDFWAIPTPLAEKVIHVLISQPWAQIAPLMRELEPYVNFVNDEPKVEIRDGVAT